VARLDLHQSDNCIHANSSYGTGAGRTTHILPDLEQGRPNDMTA
jgi:hypothetical protein